MILVIRALVSLALGCQIMGAICMLAGAFARAGHVHTANVVGFSGISIGTVLAMVLFIWLGRILEEY